MEVGLTVRGVVRDAETGQPIPEAEISTDWLVGKSVKCNGRGEYVLAGFARDRLRARAPDYGGAIERVPTAAADRDSITVDFSLKKGRRVSGRILSGTGTPISGVYIAAVSKNTGPDGGNTDWRSARSDSLGTFHFADLSAGTYVLSGRLHPGLAWVQKALQIGPSERLEGVVLPIEARGTVRGRVGNDGGAGLPMIEISAVPIGSTNGAVAYTTTTAGGEFQFFGLTHSSYRIVARPSYVNPGLQKALAWGEHKGTQPGGPALELVLPIASAIEGTVVDSDRKGRPEPPPW